eukprot:m.56181 g.56181  ORF g.56181 m.56181 type:complete len:242 (+) comp15684_c0_seq1:151-876(+)
MSLFTLQVSCSSNSIRSEKRLDSDLTIATIKDKLEMITGVMSGSQQLELRAADGSVVCALADNNATLGSYPVQDNMELHVKDTAEHSLASEFDHLEKVEKYEMPDEEYAKRQDSVLAFKMRNKLGRFDPAKAADAEAQAEAKEVEGEDDAKKMKVGERCEVSVPGKGGPKRGVVKYIGKPGFQPGWWIGVQYDEPVGKHNGTTHGKTYFSCPDKYGAFVRPAHVKTGDYPEEDLGLSDDEM